MSTLNERAADLLDEARRLIERRGWWDGVGEGGETLCAVTALGRAARQNDGERADRHRRAFVALAREASVYPPHALGVARWNDTHDAEIVMLTMKHAAERLRSPERQTDDQPRR